MFGRCYTSSFFFSSRRRHTRSYGDWSSDVCSSDLVFLISDAHRAGDPDLERYFSARALIAALAAGAIALAGILVYRADARFIYDGLTSEGLPLVIVSAACGLGVLALLWRGQRRGARPLAGGAVVAVIWGWGVAQYPYLLPQTLTIKDGAGPSGTLTAVLVVFGVAVVVVLPALGFLYTLAQRSALEGETQAPQPGRPGR